MSIPVKFTKIQSSHNRIRSREITGWTQAWPEVGAPFQMFSAPLDPDADVRYLITSTVLVMSEMLRFEKDKDPIRVVTFKTKNSTYQVEALQP